MVTLENWEEFAILRADGELDAEGKDALEAFLAAHPELAEEAQMYDSLRLVPDETVVFAGKESLFKPEPRVIRFDRRWVYGVAAAVALLVGSLAVMRSGIEEGTGDAGRIAGTVKLPSRLEQILQDPSSTPVVQSAEQKISESTAVAQTSPSREQKLGSTTPPQKIASSVQPNVEDAPAAPEAITPLLSADARLLAVNTPQVRNAERPATPNTEPPVQRPADNESRGIIDRLPIDADRFALVEDLRKSASDRIQNIRETREKIRNTDVTIALGNRDLFTLHF